MSKKTKFYCEFWGHTPTKGYGGDVPYLEIRGSTIDGIGRHHAFLYNTCEVCGQRLHVANLHLPEDQQVPVLRANVKELEVELTDAINWGSHYFNEARKLERYVSILEDFLDSAGLAAAQKIHDHAEEKFKRAMEGGTL